MDPPPPPHSSPCAIIPRPLQSDYDAYDAILHHVFRATQGDGWFKPSQESLATGVCLRVDADTRTFRMFPYQNVGLRPFEEAVKELNPVVAVKLRNASVHAALMTTKLEDKALYFDENSRIQILDTMEQVPDAEKDQNAAFLRDEAVLIVWADNLDHIIPLCRDFEEKLVQYVWKGRPQGLVSRSSSDTALALATGGGLKPAGISRHGRAISLASPGGYVGSSGSAGGHGPMSGFLSSPVTPRTPATLVGDMGDISSLSDSEKIKSAYLTPYDAEVKSRFYALGYDAERGDEYMRPLPLSREQSKQEKLAKAKGKKELKLLESNKIPERKMRLFAPVYGGSAAGLSIFFVSKGVQIMLLEHALDGDKTRFFLCAFVPLLFCISLFFSLQVITCISYVIGPIAQFHENSKYYSAAAPKANKLVDDDLPHITIQMPVYMESLKETITPSVEYLKRAMQTYARQGGSSSIFINDDGLQLLPPDKRAERLEFYNTHGIGYVARPPHSKESGGFKRAGRFKKASNMNYGLALSLKLESCIMRLEDALKTKKINRSIHKATLESVGNLSVAELESLEEEEIVAEKRDRDEQRRFEERALAMAIDETVAETGGGDCGFKPWASNAKSIRMGEIVLLVDSDTVVPEDCLRDAARELADCPEVAIIQHESDVMQVSHNYFENGIAHFSRRINRCISMACANGEVAPFVGHNAFLRWSAIQDAAFIDEADGRKKMWSEANVSEDFDMALRLQLKGYTVRWASYSNGGFKEGVSLTCDDELNRWQKYAYGCSELLFNPLIKWFTRGPISAQMHRFVWSHAPLHYKFSMLAYMFSYYGIASSVTLATLNYILLGVGFPVDGYYMHSLEILISCSGIFLFAGNIAYTILEYRLGSRNLFTALVENMMWIPFFFFFFGGISIHISQALLAHLFSYNITWGATKKEVERSNFFLEVPKILRRFWLSLLVSAAIFVAMGLLSTDIMPREYRVPAYNWAAILPLAVAAACHVLYPIVLNPWLMIFSY